jgi:hypothetical protein
MFIIFPNHGSIEIKKDKDCLIVYGHMTAIEYLVEKEEYHLIEETDKSVPQYFDSLIKLPESYVAFRLSELVLSI